MCRDARIKSSGSGVLPSSSRPGHCSNVHASCSTLVSGAEDGVPSSVVHSGQPVRVGHALHVEVAAEQDLLIGGVALEAIVEKRHRGGELGFARGGVLADVVERVGLGVADHDVEQRFVGQLDLGVDNAFGGVLIVADSVLVRHEGDMRDRRAGGHADEIGQRVRNGDAPERELAEQHQAAVLPPRPQQRDAADEPECDSPQCPAEREQAAGDHRQRPHTAVVGVGFEHVVRVGRPEPMLEDVTAVLVENLVEAQHIPRLRGGKDPVGDAIRALLDAGDRGQRSLCADLHAPGTHLHVVREHS